MKTFRLLIYVIIICSVYFTTNAQITYDETGLNIGNATTHYRYNFLINDFTGLSWTYANATKYFQCDVTTASPRLSGTNNEIVFYNSVNSTFNSIQVSNVYQHSDGRAKKNIRTIDFGLNTILKLRPVSYNWKTESDIQEEQNSFYNKNIEQNISISQANDKTQYGFIAQELEQIIPDAVITDENGNKLINYTVIMPMLVQSIQDLQIIITNQENTIANLTTKISELQNSTSDITSNRIIECTPNPSNGIVKFEYSVNDNVNSKEILITNLIGDLKFRVICDDNTSVSADLSKLGSGIHIATLVVDGNVMNSIRVVLN